MLFVSRSSVVGLVATGLRKGSPTKSKSPLVSLWEDEPQKYLDLRSNQFRETTLPAMITSSKRIPRQGKFLPSPNPPCPCPWPKLSPTQSHGPHGYSQVGGERATPGHWHHCWTGSAGTGEASSEDPPAPAGDTSEWAVDLVLPISAPSPCPSSKLSQVQNWPS